MRILQKLKSDALLRHSLILFVSMMTVHVSNVIFQMAVGRALPNTEYSLLMAFLAALAIIQRPLGTLRTAVCHYGSLLIKEERRGDVKRLLLKWILLTGAPAIAAGALAIVFSTSIAAFFHLDRTAPVIIAGALLPALCWLPILNGAGQGAQMFGWLAAAAIIGALARLFLGAGFVWFLYPACGWAMLGHGFSIYATIGVLVIGLWGVLHHWKPTGNALPSMRLYLFQSFFVLAAYAVLMTADVVLIKHFIPADSEFAYAATLGRMVVFLPGAIVSAMFPKVVSRGTLTRKQKSILLKSLAYTAVFVCIAIAGCYLLPGLLARILFGITDASDNLTRMIGAMSVVMGFNALLNVIVQFLLAQRRFKACIVTVACACFYLGGVYVLHDSTWHIIAVAAAANAAALISGWISVVKVKARDE